MGKVVYIKTFLFQSAKYIIDDGNGDKVWLEVNYKKNRYSIKQHNGSRNVEFRKEVEDVAKYLLKRKHNINRAEQLEK